MKPVAFNRPAFEQIFKECMDLGERKCHDYGAVGDAIAMGGVRGIAIRGLDKQLRIMSLTGEDFAQRVRDESLRDTLRDQINYAVYAIALLDGSWGLEPVPQATKESQAMTACIMASNYLDTNNNIEPGSDVHLLLKSAALGDLPF